MCSSDLKTGAGIPILFGVDAVHGHSNLPGATLFPHNIGLGAAGDPLLVRRIGEATAAEIAASGIEWTFAPTLAVPQDLRWGRSYEGYGADPALVAAYARAMTLGLQGALAPGRPLASGQVAATAKHFIADGGTFEGRDQGDARIEEAELVAQHAAGYRAAIDAGALTAALYRQHAAELLRFAWHRLGRIEDAEDAVQATFLSAHRVLQEGERVREPRAWLFRILRNECLTRIAMTKRRGVHEELGEWHADTRVSVADEMESRDEFDVAVAQIGRAHV